MTKCKVEETKVRNTDDPHDKFVHSKKQRRVIPNPFFESVARECTITGTPDLPGAHIPFQTNNSTRKSLSTEDPFPASNHGDTQH